MRMFLLLLLLTASLFGIELEAGKRYSGPAKLSVSSLGVSMGLPANWSAEVYKKAVVLKHEKSRNTIRLHAKHLSPTEAVNYLSTIHYMKGGIKIFPQERIIKINQHIYARAYRASGGIEQDSILLYTVLGPQERAVVVLAEYAKEDEAVVKTISMNVVQTISFTPTMQLKNVMQDLKKRLQGLHLVYMKRDGAYDEKHELWLCSNKRYMSLENRTVAGGMSRIKEQKYGKWMADDGKLILQGDDGFDTIIKVAIKNRVLFFDGVRSYELENHQCQ